MQFILTTKQVVTIRVFNEEALFSQLAESFPGEKPDALPIDLDEAEYLLLKMVQDSKIRVTSIDRQLVARFDAYGFLPNSIYAEKDYLEASALEKANKWSRFVNGLGDKHIFVSRNRYDRLKKNLPKNIISFAAGVNMVGDLESLVFCDKVISHCGHVVSHSGPQWAEPSEVLEKGCDLIRQKWNVLFKDYYKEDAPSYVFSDYETCEPLKGKVRLFSSTLSIGEYRGIVNGDVHQLLSSLKVHDFTYRYPKEYNSTISEEKFRSEAVEPQLLDRDLDLKTLSALVYDLEFTPEIERLKNKMQVTYTNILCTDENVESEIFLSVYGFIRV